MEQFVENEPKCEFQFGEKNKKPVEKSEFEEVLDTCWAELDKCLDDEESNKTDFFFQPDVDDGHSKTRTLTDCVTLCKHPDLYLDEQVGTICKSCSVVVEEMRYILPPFVSYMVSNNELDMA
ncbi:hypothetical protein POM88_050236 [Heracleum sosnowskyi]|uniref:Uncharacterized protein n=1 Tax=Heracleum sosnowskyi TaxID=360622 RepID=A0AAD8GZR1_9APIA|nr:hypothetical protein POM88_050236 [Heracleum sosnowskyi]